LWPFSRNTGSWTLANEAIVLTVTHDARGRIGVSQLQNRLTGEDWCCKPLLCPTFQMEFNRGEDRVNVSGGTAFEVLEERAQTASDGTQSLRLLLRSRRDP